MVDTGTLIALFADPNGHWANELGPSQEFNSELRLGLAGQRCTITEVTLERLIYLL